MDSFGVGHKSKGLPAEIWTSCSEEFRIGFIDGIFSADGTVDSSYSTAQIVINQSNEKLIRDISELLGFYGIKNTFSHLHIENAKFPNGKEYNREYDRYTLKISTRKSIQHFRKLFSFSVIHKQEALNAISEHSTKFALFFESS